MRQILLDNTNAGTAIRAASQSLAAGELVAIPTETVYGLAADAANGEAVARIFAAKGRPRFNPLICHVTDLPMARRYGVLDRRAERLAEAFWPGPLTLVVPLAEHAVHPLVTAGLGSIALRAPQGFAAHLIAAFGRPIAAPSANRSGRISASRAEHVVEQLGGSVSLLIDGGPCRVGIESTIVSLLGLEPVLLRPGGMDAEAIESVLAAPLARPSAQDRVTAPGMLASHYAPSARMRLDARSVRPGEALLAFGEIAVGGAERARAVRNLSPTSNLVEAAANLFAFLAELDSSGAEQIAVAPIPPDGLGEAINDRLRRAAAPRTPPHGIDAEPGDPSQAHQPITAEIA